MNFSKKEAGLIAIVVVCGLAAMFSYLHAPPIITSVLISTALATIFYGLLGGAKEASFSLGPAKLGGIAAFFMAALWFVNYQLNEQMGLDNIRERYGKLQEQLNVSKEEVNSKNRLVGEAKLELEDVNRELSKAKRDLVKARNSPEEFGVKELENINPSSQLASDLRDMVLRRKGPWRPESGEEERRVSVVGYLKSNQAAACPDTGYRDPRVETVNLISLVNRDGAYFRSAEPISISQWQTISSIECERNSSKFDVQVSCDLAAQIFTAKVVTCNKDGEPGWQLGFTNFLPVGAIAKYREAE